MALVYCFGENPLADSHAKEAAECLVAAYPNHSWWVECKGGVLVVKHFSISGKIGMVLHESKMAGSATARKRSILAAAGELLERAGIPRRDYRGEDPQDMDLPRHLRKHFSRVKPIIKVVH